MADHQHVRDAAHAASLDELFVDPYPLYDVLRQAEEPTFVPALDAWMFTRFDQVKAIHGDPARFATRFPDTINEVFKGPHVLHLDGPEHQRRRRALHGCLAPKVVQQYSEEVIGTVVDQQLESLRAKGGRAELMADYFEPISVLSLGREMGIPNIDADTLRHWFKGIILGSSNGDGDPAITAEALAVSDEIDETLRAEFERIDREPADTIISHLLQHAEGDTLAERVTDLSPTLKIVIGGGLQEPGHGAGTLAHALLEDDEARERLLAEPETMLQPAVDEALRWVAPIQIDTRMALQDATFGDTTIPAGTFVFASIAAANRDTAAFGDDADRYTITRPRSQHLGFGFGTHFCSGNYFGRVLIEMAVLRLFRAFPDLKFDDERASRSFQGFFFRAPTDLHCTL
jgi:cytochrome P450